MPGDNTLYGPGVQPRTFGRSDDNFENFIDNWRHYQDHLVVFLGAGASIGATSQVGGPFPTAIGLRDELWFEFMLTEQERADPPKLGLLSLEHSSALIESKVGRGPLVEYVGRRFRTTLPLWPHAALPFFRPRAVYTTNYDELVELGWQRHANLPRIAPVFSSRHASVADGWTPLYKPHGTAQHASAAVGDGGIVLTQFDYFSMLEQKREMLRAFLENLRANCVVFIGYSFQDMDIASMLHAMRHRSRERHWYAVFPRADSNVRSMYDREYGIRQISRTFTDFIAEAGFRLGLVPPGWEPSLPLAPSDA
jgi:hypothetical protein